MMRGFLEGVVKKAQEEVDGEWAKLPEGCEPTCELTCGNIANAHDTLGGLIGNVTDDSATAEQFQCVLTVHIMRCVFYALGSGTHWLSVIQNYKTNIQDEQFARVLESARTTLQEEELRIIDNGVDSASARRVVDPVTWRKEVNDRELAIAKKTNELLFPVKQAYRELYRNIRNMTTKSVQDLCHLTHEQFRDYSAQLRAIVLEVKLREYALTLFTIIHDHKKLKHLQRYLLRYTYLDHTARMIRMTSKKWYHEFSIDVQDIISDILNPPSVISHHLMNEIRASAIWPNTK